jgi:hypothetical protein
MDLRMLLIKITVLTALPLYVISCTYDPHHQFTANPYKNFDVETESVHQTPGLALADSSYFDQASRIPGVFITDNAFDLAQVHPDTLFIYSQLDEKIVQINREGTTYSGTVISESGAGPDQIQNGTRLYRIGDSIYLIQRHRISTLFRNDNSEQFTLRVKKQIPIYLNYYSEFSDGDSLLTNTFSYEGKKTFQIISMDFSDSSSGFGGQIKSENPDISRIFNFNVVTSNVDQSIYLQPFISLPYVGVFSEDLKLTKVYHLTDFKPSILDAEKFQNGEIERIDTDPHSMFTNIIPLSDGRTWLINEDRYYEEEEVREFQSREPQRVYHYYIISPNSEIEYVGQSKYYSVPVNDKLFFLKDGSMFVSNRTLNL